MRQEPLVNNDSLEPQKQDTAPETWVDAHGDYLFRPQMLPCPRSTGAY